MKFIKLILERKFSDERISNRGKWPNRKTNRCITSKKTGVNVIAMIRKEEQRAALEQLGAKVIIADLEDNFSSAYNNIDTVIFSAGSGGHTGPEKTIAIDQNAAIRAVQYAEHYNTSHFIMVSSVWADKPENGSESLKDYLIAKGNADKELQKVSSIIQSFVLYC